MQLNNNSNQTISVTTTKTKQVGTDYIILDLFRLISILLGMGLQPSILFDPIMLIGKAVQYSYPAR